jgi:3-oxoacyl-[acyl-carrier protein] reductase
LSFYIAITSVCYTKNIKNNNKNEDEDITMDLTGKVAIVTGSGRGIGKAIAMKLAEVGATIVINDVGDNTPAEQTVAEIKNLNRQALAVMADVSSTTDVTRLVETAIKTYGKVDILVNNAGITRDQLTMRMTDEDWDKVLTVDLKSVFLCTRAVLRPMLKQRSGRIVSIASIVGIIGNAGQANYASAKAGIIGFTKTIAKEVGSRGITANAIAPGFIDTPMTQSLPEEKRQAMLNSIPLGCLGTPRDVAEVVAFLASEEARYITGQVITVDGGISLGKL